MNDRELQEIIESRLKQVPMTITPQSVQRIVALSRGLPFYVHTLTRWAAISATDQDIWK
jgi:hypothetical protein